MEYELIWILIGGALLMTACNLLIFFLFYRASRKKQATVDQHINYFRNAVREQSAELSTNEVQVGEMNRLLKRVSERQANFESKHPSYAAYHQASKLVEMGAEVKDIVNSCGVNEAEAELVAIMKKGSGKT